MLMIKRSNTLEQQIAVLLSENIHASLKAVKKLTAPQLQRLRTAHKSLAGVCEETARRKFPMHWPKHQENVTAL